MQVSARRVREFLLMPEAVSYTICDDDMNGSETNSRRHVQGGLNDASPGSVPGSPKKPPSLTIDISKVAMQSLPAPPPSAKSLKLPKISDVNTSTDSVFAPIAEEFEEEEEEDDEPDDDEGSEAPITIEDIYDIHTQKIEPVPIRTSIKSCKGAGDRKSVSTSAPNESAAPLDVENHKLTDLTNAADLKKLEYIDDGDPDTVISIKNGEFSWEDDRNDQTLTEVDVRIPSKSLTILVGKTGSGKSSFISEIGRAHV